MGTAKKQQKAARNSETKVKTQIHSKKQDEQVSCFLSPLLEYAEGAQQAKLTWLEMRAQLNSWGQAVLLAAQPRVKTGTIAGHLRRPAATAEQGTAKYATRG
jgi:hypothetical protein